MIDSKDGLGQQVTLRVSDQDVARIDSLTEILPLKRSAVIRAAIRLGLELLEEDPALLLKRPVDTPALGTPTRQLRP